MRTAHLLGSEENKKHTNSQTIRVDKAAENNTGLEQPHQTPQLNQQTQGRTSNKIAAKLNLHGMAKNKISLQYNTT